MKATAWKLKTQNKDEFIYHLQIDDIKGKRKMNNVTKAVKDWGFFAEGYNPKNKMSMLLVKREFPTETDWILWAREFPFLLQEINGMGNPKQIKLGIASKTRRKRRKKEK